MTPTQQAVADEILRLYRVKAAHGANEAISVAAEEIVALKAQLAEMKARVIENALATKWARREAS